MKKTLIALAAVTAVAGVSAQNVSLYGRLDLGHGDRKTETTSATGSKETVKNKSLAGEQNRRNGARLGVTGSEDLGGGLKAGFVYEMGLNPDATGPAVTTTRLANLSVAGGFGTVRIGTFNNGFDAVRGNTASTVGAPGGDFLAGHINAVSGALDLSGTALNTAFAGAMDITAVNATAYNQANFALKSDFLALTAAQITTITKRAGGSTVTADQVTLGTATTNTLVATANTDIAASATAINDLVAVQIVGAALADSSDVYTLTVEDAQRLLTRYNAAAAAAAADNAAQEAEIRSLLGNGLGGRSQNSIAYTSPSINGFQFGVGLSAEDAKTSSATATTKQAKVSGQSLSLAYASGPLNARVALGTGKAISQSTAANKSEAKYTDQSFAVSYNMGFAQPYVQHERTKGELSQFRGSAISGATNIKTAATEIGARFPMGAFTPYVTLGDGEIKTTAAGVESGKYETSAYQLGTTYALSKRTSMYAAMGQQKVESKTAGNQTTSKTSGYNVGLIHAF